MPMGHNGSLRSDTSGPSSGESSPPVLAILKWFCGRRLSVPVLGLDHTSKPELYIDHFARARMIWFDSVAITTSINRKSSGKIILISFLENGCCRYTQKRKKRVWWCPDKSVRHHGIIDGTSLSQCIPPLTSRWPWRYQEKSWNKMAGNIKTWRTSCEGTNDNGAKAKDKLKCMLAVLAARLHS